MKFIKQRINDICEELSSLDQNHKCYRKDVESIIEKALTKEWKFAKEACCDNMIKATMRLSGGHTLIKALEACDIISNTDGK